MASAAKVVRIEIRVGGGSGGGSKGGRKKDPTKAEERKRKSEQHKKQLAIAGGIGIAAQAVSKGFDIMEAYSYGSLESEQRMALSLTKTAVSTALVAVGSAWGPIGAVVGGIVAKATDPLWTAGGIQIQRGLDETRMTNRFYQTNFAGTGNYVFNYASGGYINEDLTKVSKGSFYKKGSAF